MATRTRKRAARKGARRGRRRPARRARTSLALSLPATRPLLQRERDLLGLALAALSVLFATVFYLGWAGGRVGEAMADALVFLFGGVAYLTPIALFLTGVLLVMGPLLQTVRPFKAGAACLVSGLLLGLGAGTLGLGPSDPPREGSLWDRAYFEEHGGAVGEALYVGVRTLFQDTGAHILFAFLVLAGVLLLTGGSIAGAIRITRSSVATTTRRVRRSTSEFAAVVTRRPVPAPSAPEDDGAVRVPADSGEAIVRASWVEAPAQDGAETPEPAEAPEPPLDPIPAPEEPEIELHAGQAREPVVSLEDDAELTPMGNRRSSVTEADGHEYSLPGPTLLAKGDPSARMDPAAQAQVGERLVEALRNHGIEASLLRAVSGPAVTRYELEVGLGVKMNRIEALDKDIAYALAATDVRILAPIPGRQAVGVEVPNERRATVTLRDIFQEPPPKDWSPLFVWLGKNIAGKAVGTDLAKQPHILIAGTTGSGKSGCINAMLTSILLRASPNELRMVLVDPKQVELNHYEHIPHLLTPVVTSPKLANNVLQNLVREMEERYTLMASVKAKNLRELNKIRERDGDRRLPYILCVIDELADLMMIAPAEVEDSVIRLAQKSRAVGIHLVLATQRPSVKVITGLIKANVPARIAFAVSSQVDSRVILDQNGAEALLGAGDMLFRDAGESKLSRVQGAFVGEEELARITDHWRAQGEPEIHEELLEAAEPAEEEGHAGDYDPDEDDLLPQAIRVIAEMGSASTSGLQRRLRVGYTRAGRLIDMMERRGVVGPFEGSKSRQVLITEADVSRIIAALGEPPGESPDAEPAMSL